MTDVRFAPGSGRLLHTGDWVVYAPTRDDALFGVFQDDSVDKTAIGKHIFERNLELSPFVAFSVGDEVLLVFGDLTVEVDGDSVHGLSASPWVERTITAGTSLACGGVDADADLLGRGNVSAGAFALVDRDAPARSTGDIASTTPADISPATEQPPPDITPAPSPEPHDQPTPADPTEDATAESAPEPDRTHDDEPVSAPAAPQAGPLSADTDRTDDEWDPLADPDVDLDRIGVVEFTDDLSTTPPPEPAPEPPLADPDTDDDHGDPGQPVWNRPPVPPPAPPRPVVPTPPAGPPVAPPPPSIPPPPGIASGPTDELKSAPTIPSPPPTGSGPRTTPTRHSLRFDDGQEVSVDVGVYVGRHPTKQGLPDGYQSVTIRGEHVSRRHWELAIVDGAARVRDLGSNSGTSIDVHGSVAPVPPDGIELASGAMVQFADRWARYEMG